MKSFSTNQIVVVTHDDRFVTHELERLVFLICRIARNKFELQIPFRLLALGKAHTNFIGASANMHTRAPNLSWLIAKK